MPYQFHITNSFTTDDTPQFNQFNFLISSNLSLLQYIIHMFLLPFHFFSTASTIQSSIHPISSILSLHQCSLSSFHPLLTLSPPSLYSLTNNCYSINPYLLYASHITSPSSYLPYTQFSYTLHPIFPSVTTIFPSTTSTIPYSMLSSLPRICLAHFLYCPPHSTTTTLGSRPRRSFIVLLPR